MNHAVLSLPSFHAKRLVKRMEQPTAKFIIEETGSGRVYWPANPVAVSICSRYKLIRLRDKHIKECWHDCRMVDPAGNPLPAPDKVEIIA